MNLYLRSQTFVGLGLILSLVLLPTVADAKRRWDHDSKWASSREHSHPARHWRKSATRVARTKHVRGWRHEHRRRRQGR